MKGNYNKIIALCAVLTLTLFSFFISTKGFGKKDAEALSKFGSRGNEVTNIQTRLKRWDYYKGDIDGMFGSRTKEAVIKFQRKNGLRVDGIAGPETLAAIGLPTGSGNSGISQSDINLLARMISAEARGEPYSGQVAVGAVILNRVEHPPFPIQYRECFIKTERLQQ